MTVATPTPTSVREQLVTNLAEILPHYFRVQMGEEIDWTRKAEQVLADIEGKGYLFDRLDRP